MYFKENLRYLRISNNETQDELGDRFGFGKSTISNYETGNTTPSLEVLIQIAKYYNVTVDDLLLKKMGAEIHLAKNLCFLRAEKGITQEELAKNLHMEQKAWSTYERGQRIPPLKKLVEIARYFNVTLDELVTVNLKEAKQ